MRTVRCCSRLLIECWARSWMRRIWSRRRFFAGSGRGLSTVESERAFLTTILTRLCIDHFAPPGSDANSMLVCGYPSRSWVRRMRTRGGRIGAPGEHFHGVSGTAGGASPAERACFLLHEVFGYGYAEISDITGEREVNCRQMVSRSGGESPMAVRDSR